MGFVPLSQEEAAAFKPPTFKPLTRAEAKIFEKGVGYSPITKEQELSAIGAYVPPETPVVAPQQPMVSMQPSTQEQALQALGYTPDDIKRGTGLTFQEQTLEPLAQAFLNRHNKPEKAKSVTEFVAKTIPESFGKTVINMAMLPADIIMMMENAPKKSEAVKQILKGAAEGMSMAIGGAFDSADNFGFSLERLKENWTTDPVGSLASLAGLFGFAARGTQLQKITLTEAWDYINAYTNNVKKLPSGKVDYVDVQWKDAVQKALPDIQKRLPPAPADAVATAEIVPPSPVPSRPTVEILQRPTPSFVPLVEQPKAQVTTVEPPAIPSEIGAESLQRPSQVFVPLQDSQVKPPEPVAKPAETVTEPPLPTEPKVKELWEMTRGEYGEKEWQNKLDNYNKIKSEYNTDAYDDIISNHIENKKKVIEDILNDREGHRGYIKRMVSSGKPVPAEVLKDYPELVKEPVKVGNTVTSPAGEKKAASGTLTTKQQKKYLIDEIDKAIKEAPEGYGKVEIEEVKKAAPVGRKDKAYRVKNLSEIDTVTIEVPGDGEFTIPNTQYHLSEFKKRVSKSFPASDTLVPPKTSKSVSTKATGKRLSGEGIEYYNPYKVRERKEPVYGSVQDTEGNLAFIYDDGYLSNNQYAIRVPRPNNVAIIPTPKPGMIKGAIPPKKGYQKAQIIAEVSINGDGPYIEVMGENGNRLTLNPDMVDHIMTMYPKAKVYIPDERYGTVLFEVNKQNVALLMPIRQDQILSQYTAKARQFYNEKADIAPPPKSKKQPEEGTKSTADTGGYADLGDYERNINPSYLDMPEIAKIAKELTGRYPKVAERLRNAAWLGVFYGKGEGKIHLKAPIFRDPVVAAKVMAHEIGHLVDWLPDKDMSKGNILGRIASIKKYAKHILEEYPGAPGTLTPKDRDRIRREAEKLVKAEQKAAEGKQDTTGPKVTPEDILAIWNDATGRTNNQALYEYIAKASTAEKKSIIKAAMSGQVPDVLKNLITRNIPYTDWAVRQKEIFQDLLHKEIAKRKLYEMETVLDELKKVTQIWKPFNESANPKFTKYRYSSKELYADAISVLMNNPVILKTNAPTFYKAFFSWLEKKPEVREAWYQVQELVSDPVAVRKQREQDILDDYNRGREIRNTDKRASVNILYELRKAFEDQNIKIYSLKKLAKEKGVAIDPEKDPTYWAEELPYIEDIVYDHYLKTDSGILRPLKASGMTVDDLGLYYQMNRVINERSKMANPRGHTPQTAQTVLDALKERVGDENYNRLQEFADRYWQYRKENVFPHMEKSGIYTPELVEHIKNNPWYAPFKLMDYLEKRWGKNATAKVFKQIGTLQEIDNPFIQLLLTDAAIIRASQVAMAKKDIGSFLAEMGESKPAETKFDATLKARVLKEPDDPEWGLVMYPENGKMTGYYAPKDLADMFNRAPYEAKALVNAWQAGTGVLKQVLVSKNPLWQLRNIIRDFRSTLLKIPGATIPNLAPKYIDAIIEATREVFQGKDPEVVSKMLKAKALVIDRQYTPFEETTQMGKMDKVIEALNNPKKAPMILKPLAALLDLLEKTGKVSERAGKIAGYEYLMQYYPNLSEKEIAHYVRGMAGTPDIYRRGTLSPWYNSIFLFSNVSKEGIRSAAEAFSSNKKQFAWKTFKYVVLPKLLMFAAGAGLFGSYMKSVMDKASEYDKAHYDVIPLWITNEGDGVIVRIPKGYEEQVMGAVLWRLLSGKIMGQKGAVSALYQASPYSLNPILSTMSNIIDYYARGVVPQDDWRGKPILPEEVAKAGGWPAAKGIMASTWNSLGGSTIYNWQPHALERKQSMVQKALKYPPLNLAGVFLKVTNQGESEIYGDIKDPIRQARAKENIAAREAIINDVIQERPVGPQVLFAKLVRDKQLQYKLLVGGKYDPLSAYREFVETYRNIAILRQNIPVASEYINAQSSEEKMAVLLKYLQRKQEGLK